MNVALLARARRVVDSATAIVPVDPGSPYSYWAMDSVAATTGDSVGGRPLTANGTVATEGGKLSNCLNLTSGDAYLSSASADFNFGDTTFSIALWVKVSAVTSQDILKKFHPGGYKIQYDNAQGIGFYCTNGTIQANAYSGVLMDADEWYFVAAYHNATTNEIGVSVNGAAFVTTSYSGGCGTTPSEFVIGANAIYIIIDETGVWNNLALSAANVAFLWNSGTGQTYS